MCTIVKTHVYSATHSALAHGISSQFQLENLISLAIMLVHERNLLNTKENELGCP